MEEKSFSEASAPQTKLKQVNVKMASSFINTFQPPPEDTEEQRQKIREAKMVEEEKEKNKVTSKDANRKLLKRKLETHLLKKAAGKCLDTLDHIMERYYIDLFNKLIKVCRKDETKHIKILSKNRLDWMKYSQSEIAESDFLYSQSFMLRNKYISVTNEEHVQPVAGLELLFTSNTFAKLQQTDEDRMKLIKEKKKKVRFPYNSYRSKNSKT